MKDKEFDLLNKRRFVLKQKLENFAISIPFVIAPVGVIAFIVASNFGFFDTVRADLVYLGVLGIVVIGIVVLIVIGKLSDSYEFINLLIRIIDLTNNGKIKESRIEVLSRYRLLSISGILFSAKTQKEVFEVTIADWDNEIYIALEKNKDARLFMINLRNTYAFLIAMWMKSPIGDLIEFIRKFAK